MRVSPRLHNIEFGEGLRWATPAGTATFFLWSKRIPDESAPRWSQTAGFNVALNVAIRFGGEVTPFVLGAGGATGTWGALLAAFAGFDPEVLMVTAQNGAGAVLSIDRYRLPSPNSTDAASIAAEERRVLQTLLKQREEYAKVVGHVKVGTPDGTTVERMDFAALDRRIAEIRARIVWFDTAAGGNSLPRAEHW